MIRRILRLVKKQDSSLVLLEALVLIAILLALWQGGWQLVSEGLEQAVHLFDSVWLRLILGFILGGLVQVLIPRDVIAKWLGQTSGIRGILIGSYLGIIMPGGPWVNLPIIAAIYRAGAGIGPVFALITGRTVLGLQALVVWQIPFLGIELSLVRYIISLAVPPLVGITAAALYRLRGKHINSYNERQSD